MISPTTDCQVQIQPEMDLDYGIWAGLLSTVAIEVHYDLRALGGYVIEYYEPFSDYIGVLGGSNFDSINIDDTHTFSTELDAYVNYYLCVKVSGYSTYNAEVEDVSDTHDCAYLEVTDISYSFK